MYRELKQHVLYIEYIKWTKKAKKKPAAIKQFSISVMIINIQTRSTETSDSYFPKHLMLVCSVPSRLYLDLGFMERLVEGTEKKRDLWSYSLPSFPSANLSSIQPAGNEWKQVQHKLCNFANSRMPIVRMLVCVVQIEIPHIRDHSYCLKCVWRSQQGKTSSFSNGMKSTTLRLTIACLKTTSND